MLKIINQSQLESLAMVNKLIYMAIYHVYNLKSKKKKHYVLISKIKEFTYIRVFLFFTCITSGQTPVLSISSCMWCWRKLETPIFFTLPENWNIMLAQ